MAERRIDYRDLGLLVLRIGIGVAFMAHGWPKLAGGPAFWKGLGTTGGFGHVFPVFWGFVAAIVEFGGGLLVALGLFFRIACAFLVIQMLAALNVHLHASGQKGTFDMWSHAFEDGVVFLSLLMIGPGRYSIKGIKLR